MDNFHRSVIHRLYLFCDGRLSPASWQLIHEIRDSEALLILKPSVRELKRPSPIYSSFVTFEDLREQRLDV